MTHSGHTVVQRSSGVHQKSCNTTLALARASFCPAPDWQRTVAPVLLGMARSVQLINVGANKGYAVNAFLQQYLPGWRSSNRAWFDVLRAGNASAWSKSGGHSFHNGSWHSWHPLCGVCAPCVAGDLPPAATDLMGNESRVAVSVIAAEMMAPTARLLQRVFARLRVPGTVLHVAVSDRKGNASTPSLAANQAGVEFATVGAAGPRPARSSGMSVVKQTTVDAILEGHRGASAAQAGAYIVLSVDTEGLDALVLRGASGGGARPVQGDRARRSAPQQPAG